MAGDGQRYTCQRDTCQRYTGQRCTGTRGELKELIFLLRTGEGSPMPPVVFKGRPPRITPFGDNKWPVYFVTCCTLQRRRWLANSGIHDAWQEFGLRGKDLGVAIGRYVIMPDHIHFFVRLAPERRLDMTVRGLKRVLSYAVASEVRGEWQPGFFDHLLRREESLSEKWIYVGNNPVRAGLVNDAAEWPFAGEIVNLTF